MIRNVVVTIDDEHRGSGAQVDKIVRDLSDAGMVVDRVLNRSGIVTGAVDDVQHRRLTSVEGVLAVEEEGQKHILS